MENTKILIIGQHNIDKISIAKKLSNYIGDLEIGGTFVSNKITDYDNAEFLYHLNTDEINLCYKNNALLYVHNINSKEYILKGITLDTFYNSDILFMDIKDFNNISDSIFIHNNILVVWLDTKNTKHLDYSVLYDEIQETKYLMDRLSNINYLYFLDEHPVKIVNTIMNYLEANDEDKEKILKENS